MHVNKVELRNKACGFVFLSHYVTSTRVNHRVRHFLALGFVRGRVDTWYMEVNGRVSYFLALGFVQGKVDTR